MTSAFFLGILIRHRYLQHYIEDFCSPGRRDLLEKLMEKNNNKQQARKQTNKQTHPHPPPTPPVFGFFVVVFCFGLFVF